MNGAFRVVSTAAFEREFRKISRGDARLVQGLEELIAVLATDPHNRSGEYQIKKLQDRRPEKANGEFACASIDCATTSLGMRLFCIRSGIAKKLTDEGDGGSFAMMAWSKLAVAERGA
jgi:hypothetical protein